MAGPTLCYPVTRLYGAFQLYSLLKKGPAVKWSFESLKKIRGDIFTLIKFYTDSGSILSSFCYVGTYTCCIEQNERKKDKNY